MTKYVLNSGNLRGNPDKAKRFFAEIVKGLGPNPKMLIALFSQRREDWEIIFARYQESMPGLMPEGVASKLEMAFPGTFKEQIKQSDIVFLPGGDDHLIKYWLGQFDIPKIWRGKVVAGASAGSDVLSKYFWTCDWRENMDGLGILPIKFLSHYKSHYGADDPFRGPVGWDKAYRELEAYGEKLPIHALKEGDFVTIEVDD